MSNKKDNSQVEKALEPIPGNQRTDQSAENQNIAAAHVQADKDIVKDPDLHAPNRKEDDLDEGEIARLGGD